MLRYSLLLLAALFFGSGKAGAQAYRQPDAAEILLNLNKLNTFGSVLYIAAHPDDENTRLLAYMANERLMRTSYLSLTRGDGGQNLIGTEQSELLGLIRTQELLAARSIDRAEQYFTRAVDFGYSKNPEETFEHWDRELVLSDVVWTIRKLKPDVIITRFPTNGDGGHGHHTASALLAAEAFEAAADPNRFPEQLKYVETWQARRLLWNHWGRWRNPNEDVSDLISIEVNQYNPLLGMSYGEIAARSRSMHKSQGFGSASQRDSIREYFQYLKGDKPSKDPLEGVSTSPERMPDGKTFGKIVDKAIKEYNPAQPEAILPSLLKAHKLLENKEDYWSKYKREQIEKLIVQVAGLHLEVVTTEPYVVPGQELEITFNANNRSSQGIRVSCILTYTPSDFAGMSSAGGGQVNLLPEGAICNAYPVAAYGNFSQKQKIKIPSNSRYSTPYWLQTTRKGDLFEVKQQSLIGLPESITPLQSAVTLIFGDQSFEAQLPVMYKWVDPVEGEQYRPVEIVPEVTVNFTQKAYLFPNKQPQEVKVFVQSSIKDAGGAVKLALPEGWTSKPAYLPFDALDKGETHLLSFMVYPPEKMTTGQELTMKAVVDLDNNQLSASLSRIEHTHIPTQTLLYPADASIVPIDVTIRGQRVGYIMGAGDEVPDALRRIGYDVVLLTDDMLANDTISRYDAIVVGIRAYNTRDRLAYVQERLMEYVKGGGTLVAQYNTANRISSVKSEIGPYPLELSRDRVTVENAPVEILEPQHLVFNTPNKITQADFEGWIQERGLYFASKWDEKYTPLLAMKDPGEETSKGSLLVAQYGKGYFVYTGLSFFRELPAGVPGAYRLFANLVSLKAQATESAK